MALTVVMYHYVRPLAQSRYPHIKGLERDLFVQQIRYIKRFYTPVSGQQVLDAIKGGDELPGNAMLLTFDDGYLDHFVNVLPILVREGISGAFFPPARCILENRVLDVNKIHYVLACMQDKAQIVGEIDRAVEEAAAQHELEPINVYREKYAVGNRFDPPEVIYIKRMLQVALPAQLRARITDELFARYVSRDESTFARDLYMNEEQIKALLDSGMMVGGHGYNHDWLNRLDPSELALDIDRSMDFLRQLGVKTSDWVMCYPYGAWGEPVLQLLRTRGCAMGFTTQTAIADIGSCDPLLLPRLDTNDLPTEGDAAPVQWTLSIQ